MSKLLSLITLLAASAHANDTTCGDDPDKVPNCDKPENHDEYKPKAPV